MKKTGRNVVVLWRHFTIHFRMIHFGKPKENVCLLVWLSLRTLFFIEKNAFFSVSWIDEFFGLEFFHSLTQPNKQNQKKKSILAFNRNRKDIEKNFVFRIERNRANNLSPVFLFLFMNERNE